jgi:hypothetical protein
MINDFPDITFVHQEIVLFSRAFVFSGGLYHLDNVQRSGMGGWMASGSGQTPDGLMDVLNVSFPP